jgi:hypothetical protein
MPVHGRERSKKTIPRKVLQPVETSNLPHFKYVSSLFDMDKNDRGKYQGKSYTKKLSIDRLCVDVEEDGESENLVSSNYFR